MGVYSVRDLHNRLLLTVDFPLISPSKVYAQVRSADGEYLGKVLTGVWESSEYFDWDGFSVGTFKPPTWPTSPANAPMHFQGKQRGALRIENNSTIHWSNDISKIGSFEDLPLTARILSGWTEEESRILERNAPTGEPYQYVIDGANRSRLLVTGMAVFAYEVFFHI